MRRGHSTSPRDLGDAQSIPMRQTILWSQGCQIKSSRGVLWVVPFSGLVPDMRQLRDRLVPLFAEQRR